MRTFEQQIKETKILIIINICRAIMKQNAIIKKKIKIIISFEST